MRAGELLRREDGLLGPALSSVERVQGAIRLHFANTDGGLVVKGDKLGEFSIAGEDRKWVWADARIEGDTVVVSSPAVPDPKEVRYAWQGNPLRRCSTGGAACGAIPHRHVASAYAGAKDLLAW